MGLLRIAHRSAEAMEPELVEVVARPALPLARPEVTSLALHAQTSETSPHVRVELVEALRGVPRAEVVPPPAQERVQVADDVAEIRVTSRPRGQLLHTLPDALHRARRRPALEEVEALALLLQELAAQPLVQVAAEEIEALFAIVELDSPRLVGV